MKNNPGLQQVGFTCNIFGRSGKSQEAESGNRDRPTDCLPGNLGCACGGFAKEPVPVANEWRWLLK
jgi:hypothetical protein